tara:strand:+ start:104 stop:1426 length:1323 start_codon:yes stop_codon:yes gene_type:complete
MTIMIPQAMCSPDQFQSIMMATANKLIETAVKQTGTSADDWVVRQFLPDGGTGPSGGPTGSQTPDRSFATAALTNAGSLGWTMDVTSGMEGDASTAWESVLVSTQRSVPDNTFYGFFGAWEQAVHSSQTAHYMANGPMLDGVKFQSGASVLDLWWTQDCMNLSSESVGAITTSPVIFAQNTPLDIQFYVADKAQFHAHAEMDHCIGLYGLTCERVGETLSTPGIHLAIPMGMVTPAQFQETQNRVANELINRAVSQTGIAASEFMVRPFIGDSGTSTEDALTSTDLTHAATHADGTNTGWRADVSAMVDGAWTTVLTDQTVPDNKWMAFYGGFESPMQYTTGSGTDDSAASHVTSAWCLTRGASTEALWSAELYSSWAAEWSFLATDPVYYDQNSPINIYHLKANIETYNSTGVVDAPVGLFGMVCERIGENVSASKMTH